VINRDGVRSSQQILSNAFEIPNEAIISLPVNSETSSTFFFSLSKFILASTTPSNVILPEYTKAWLTSMTVKELRPICKAHNIKQGIVLIF